MVSNLDTTGMSRRKRRGRTGVAIGSLCVALAVSPPVYGQTGNIGIDPNIQQRTDESIVRPSSDELIIKRKLNTEKKPKTKNGASTQKTYPREQGEGR